MVENDDPNNNHYFESAKSGPVAYMKRIHQYDEFIKKEELLYILMSTEQQLYYYNKMLNVKRILFNKGKPTAHIY